jgi:hypothetical protein
MRGKHSAYRHSGDEYGLPADTSFEHIVFLRGLLAFHVCFYGHSLKLCFCLFSDYGLLVVSSRRNSVKVILPPLGDVSLALDLRENGQLF